jgi:hypothetical protein
MTKYDVYGEPDNRLPPITSGSVQSMVPDDDVRTKSVRDGWGCARTVSVSGSGAV